MDTYLTLDYELFMGSNTGTPSCCLFSPMRALDEMLSSKSIRANVFVDAAYLLRLSELSANDAVSASDFTAVCDNIRELSERGHDIQFHFHPQWLYSERSSSRGGWNMDFTHYKLSDCEWDRIGDALVRGFHLLQSLSKNKICAFRAGGYSLMDFNRYRDVFLQLGMVFDTTVVPGSSAFTRFHEYDYRKVPCKSRYSFDSSICKEECGGAFWEVPISTVSYSTPRYLLIKKELMSEDNTHKWGNGIGVAAALSGIEMVKKRVKGLMSKHFVSATIDWPLAGHIEMVYRDVKKKGFSDFVIIGHPKSITPGSISRFESFVNKHPELVFKVFSEQ